MGLNLWRSSRSSYIFVSQRDKKNPDFIRDIECELDILISCQQFDVIEENGKNRTIILKVSKTDKEQKLSN